jgi:alpha-L-fucosidase
MKNSTCFLFIFFLLLLQTNSAQNLKGGGEANPELLTNKQSLEEWKDLRFGMFIHWGPVALRGTEIGWSRGEEISFEDYDQLYTEFNPVLFNADSWAETAKKAGMKYMVLVTRHHDGFSIWDTAFSEYDIMSTPFKRDIVRELADACKKQGLMFGTYYSICDWFHPDYPNKYAHAGRIIIKEGGDMDAFNKFIRGQLTELVVEYKSRLIWFDGEWEDPWTHEMGMELYSWLRDLDDSLLINNRVDKGKRGLLGSSKSDRFAGDFETPEQQIGAYNTLTPWETCITIGDQWAWKPNDKLKSFEECLRILLHTAGGDGNLLLNVGPMLDGRIEKRQVEILEKIGSWLDIYGEALYGTRGGPVPPRDWGVTTHKDRILYVTLTDNNRKEVFLPGVTLTSAASLAGGEKLDFENGKYGAVLKTEGLTGEPFTVVKAVME